MEYEDYIKTKEIKGLNTGFNPSPINNNLFNFQKAIVRWAIRKGRVALFEDCGMGKTYQQLEWAKQVCDHTNGRVLILAPLAVSNQTQQEGVKFGYNVNICKSQDDIVDGINITNYEKIHKFDLSELGGVVADESGILKNYAGKVRNQIIDSTLRVPYKLACTATPAPNDYMELGNHAEFLGVMSRTEMLATFFVNDSKESSKWRLKKHAQSEFWKWISTWAVMIKSPADIGFGDDGYCLPELIIHSIETNGSGHVKQGYLFPMQAETLSERREARRHSIKERINEAAKLVNNNDNFWIVWCDLNEESRLLTKSIPGAVEIKGSDTEYHKTSSMIKFAAGEIRVLVTKPKIAGHGLNWQHCCNIVFVGLSDSWEAYYQAIRRCWRFGQKENVSAYIITSNMEGAVVNNIQAKEKRSVEMHKEMVKHMSRFFSEDNEVVAGSEKIDNEVITGDNWRMEQGDCVDIINTIDDNSIDYSIFSPPFASLYTYSDNIRDMGNSKTEEDFFNHFGYLCIELHRVIRPGRLVSIHCMNLPAMKERDGYIGIKDFRGDIIRLFQSNGFIYHSEVCIWKDPLVEATRTKALGLMHKQLCKDSSRCRQGLPDYIVTMRKPGDNKELINHKDGLIEFVGEDPPEGGVLSHNIWRRYASPIWMDIRQTRTLNYRIARSNNDERHICPLQLDTIERCVELWSNPGDTVLTPFAGVGSEVYVAVEKGRYGIGIELKKQYFDTAIKNLNELRIKQSQLTMF